MVWPCDPLSPCSLSETSWVTEWEKDGGKQKGSLRWCRAGLSFTGSSIWSGVFAARGTLYWCETFARSLRSSAAPQLSSQAEHLVKTHSVDLETITNGPDALAYYHSTFHFEDICKRGLHPCTFSHRCVCMCVCVDVASPYEDILFCACFRTLRKIYFFTQSLL